ncbi:formylglycine-generating enzyme family protein [Methylocystis heyeri]|uniref:formylglycine-generating enzyme family protein n=1 Tax=Methylocystis heyeri TaxID=391905 RepID=UPI001389942E|nr:formylglycine-generating enzyme family protein [Methylocystis heyeri]
MVFLQLLATEGLAAPKGGRAPEREAATAAAPTASSASLEVRYWNSIKNSKAAADFQMYLDAYPDGQFADEARARLRQIEGGPDEGPSNQLDIKPSNQLDIKPASPSPPRPAAPTPTPAVTRDCPQCPQLTLIPAGAFNMGSSDGFPFEAPIHHVVIAKPFLMGQREITLAEWDACVTEGGCSYAPPDRGAGRETFPVTNVDWNDARQYVAWLSKKTGKTYRLPSESEWEYAARAGSATAYPWGAAMEKNRANCSGCGDRPTHEPTQTGFYPANAFGLYDMAGNAAEWVEDCWNDSYKKAPTDESAWTKGSCNERVLRGGAFNNDPRYLRSASRFKYDFDVRYSANGFRVVREQ